MGKLTPEQQEEIATCVKRVSAIIGETIKAPTAVHCSFCGAHQKDRETIISAHNVVFICNECVDICNQVLNRKVDEVKFNEFWGTDI